MSTSLPTVVSILAINFQGQPLPPVEQIIDLDAMAGAHNTHKTEADRVQVNACYSWSPSVRRRKLEMQGGAVGKHAPANASTLIRIRAAIIDGLPLRTV